jgi:deazaflavin-dependent oxidoreductase (nitroreductase family)
VASLQARLERALAGPLIEIHRRVYELSGGRVGHHIPGVPPVLLLEHVGRRSGRRRRSPLAYLEDGDDLVVIASRGGSPQHPAWWLNLREMPETTVWLGSERRRVRPSRAGAEERARLWPRILDMYRGYETYQRRTEREIPVVILSPAGTG